jgi:hypothetical protein
LSHHVGWYEFTNISEVCPATIIALMMEAVQTSETLVNSYKSTQCYNSEDSHLHSHHRENLKSYLVSYSTSQHQLTITDLLGLHTAALWTLKKYSTIYRIRCLSRKLYDTKSREWDRPTESWTLIKEKSHNLHILHWFFDVKDTLAPQYTTMYHLHLKLSLSMIKHLISRYHLTFWFKVYIYGIPVLFQLAVYQFDPNQESD